GGFAGYLFGREIRVLALQHVARGGARVAQRRTRDAEVAELYVAVLGEIDVRRRDVAVNDAERAPFVVAEAVHASEGLADLAGDGDGDARRDALAFRLRLAHEPERVDAAHVLHREIRLIVDLAGFEDFDDVGVADRLVEPRFRCERRAAGRIVQDPGKHPLDDDGRSVGGAIDAT